MQRRNFLWCFILIFMVVVMTACGNQSDDEVQSDGGEAASSEESDQENQENESNSGDAQNNGETDIASNDEPSSNEETDSNEETNDDNQSTNVSDSSSSDDNNDLPATIEINEQIQHEDGITFTLEQIAFEEDHVTVDFNAENHSGYSKYLASQGRAKGSNLGGITLQDDTGYDYRYVADEDSDRIELEDQEKVTGTVSFAGRIQDDAESLTLIFNPDRALEFAFEDIEIER